MPTLRFEYTDNLNIAHKLKSCFQEIHYILVDLIKTDLVTCRSLITCYQNYVAGDGNDKNAFMQLTITLLPGRTDALKQELGNTLFEKISQTFSEEISQCRTEIRVYIQEAVTGHYFGL